MIANVVIAGYVGACHAGAAIEALCYASGPVNSSSNSNQFYFDFGGYDPETGATTQPGWISWLLPYTDSDGNAATQVSPMQLSPSWSSNVAAGLFQPGETYTYLGYDDSRKLYISGGYDDSSFNATRPQPAPVGPLYNWHLCYQYTGGYYYQSVAWVSTDPPHNPSCEPIDLTFEDVTS